MCGVKDEKHLRNVRPAGGRFTHAFHFALPMNKFLDE